MPKIVGRLILKGTKGLAQDETFYVNYGQIVNIGRAPYCEISYQDFKNYPKDESRDYTLNISREHLRISFYNTHSVQLKDLSSNGTFVNGRAIRKIFITDIVDKSYEIKLGTTETFLLSADTISK
ncbi:MAG: FHA domain-containing protein [Candidatus Brocadiia bacterium]